MTKHCVPSSKLLMLVALVAVICAALAAAVLAVVLQVQGDSPASGDKISDNSQDEGTSNEYQIETDVSYVTVSTQYGDIRGLTHRVSKNKSVDVFLGIPFAQPPVGKLRFARPEPVTPWSPQVKNATRYGDMCVQQDTQTYNLTTTSEDCLYLNIYAPSLVDGEVSNKSGLPVMFYIHGGSFRDASAIYFNYTNLAVKDVVVVTTNYRLDGFGFLSTGDDVIPGNFGLLDAALALEFVKTIIDSFGGNPNQVTLFGASAGSAMVTQMALSPLTRGKFQKAIMQSGPGTCTWSSYLPGSPNVPRQVALNLGRRLNCDLTDTDSDRDQSVALLECLRNETAQNIITQIHNLTVEDYDSAIIFVPVSGDAFGVLPETPSKLASNPSSMVPIPTIFGWSTNDSSWTVNDPDNKGEPYEAVAALIQLYATALYPTNQTEMYQKAMEIYGATNSSQLSPYDVRFIDVLFRTDLLMESFIVKEARQFAKAATVGASGAKTFVYQYDYRPSYKRNPLWQGVTHMDERGMVMGLPNGPNPFTYPVTTPDDQTVGELMTTMWSNFAKFGDPTPQPLPGGVKWPQFGHSSNDQNVLRIRPEPEVRRFDREDPIVLWTGSSGLDD